MRSDPSPGGLPLEECWDLLRRSSVGRLALSARALPVILPVQHHVEGRTIVMCIGSGLPFDPVVHDVVAAFAVESIDAARATGWTVHVQGMIRNLERPDRSDRCSLGSGLLIRMDPEVVTGWRVKMCPVGGLDPWTALN